MTGTKPKPQAEDSELLAARWACVCSMSVPRYPGPAPGLPAPLRTPAGWWQRPRQQLEQQSPSPCGTRCCPWPWSLPLPPHLPAWRPGSALPRRTGRRVPAQGLGRGPRSPGARRPP